jgi:phage head maturation protease
MNRSVNGCSFGFTVPKSGDRFCSENGKDYRILSDVDLFEITLTPAPAYKATNASFRSIDFNEEDCLKRYAEWTTARVLELIANLTQPA